MATGDAKTIDDVAAKLDVDADNLIKSMLYIADKKPVLALLRGDDELNEVKLKNFLQADFLAPATNEDAEKIWGRVPLA